MIEEDELAMPEIKVIDPSAVKNSGGIRQSQTF